MASHLSEEKSARHRHATLFWLQFLDNLALIKSTEQRIVWTLRRITVKILHKHFSFRLKFRSKCKIHLKKLTWSVILPKTHLTDTPLHFNAWNCTSKMVLLCALSGLSRRFQRWDLWLRPPSSSLSVVSCRDTCGRLRLRELIRWRDPGSWSLNRWEESKEHRGNGSAATRGRQSKIQLQIWCPTCSLCPLYQHRRHSPPEDPTAHTPPAQRVNTSRNK